MEELIARLHAGSDLDSFDINRAVQALIAANVADTIKADFLKALREKGESAMEIAGFAKALLGHAIDPGIERARLPAPILDICGTGGDRMELFNVSTTSMFVLAAAGAVVVKHGNRAITSQCGGADVLEELGVRIDLPPADLRRCVESLGIGFVFAPSYHPAFKAITPVRKLLAGQGIPTIFNMLGPLLNPAIPEYQLVGVFSRSLLDKYARSLAALGRIRAWAVHGDGADELATTGLSDVREVTPAAIRSLIVDPHALGLTRSNAAQLRGGDRRENARILVAILDGSERGPRREIVALNAAAGFLIVGLASDLNDGLGLAMRQIDEGRALAKLRALQAFK
jgi:anthranilate phosphoribosyltransferase